MIPQNELRVGNYVKVEGHPDGYAQIDHFSEEYAYFKIGHDNFKFMEPIPLTPEWLIRFGSIFPYEDNRVQIGILCFYWNGKKLYLNESGWQEEIGEYPIATVHHLQNLSFYLTGEELTLKP